MRIRAFLADPEAENRVHNPADAAGWGFAGGLVPGVDVYAYLTRPVVERFGREWLHQGRCELRLLKPVFGGDELEIGFDGETATATRVDGTLCATLKVTERRLITLDVWPLKPLPARRWEPSEASFKEHGFGSYKQTVTEEQARRHLREVLETLPIYEKEAIVHPAHLLRFANTALSASYRLGPWLHVGSDIQHVEGPVLRGSEIETATRLNECFERKGHRFVRYTVRMIGAEVVHTAIYEPAFVRGTPA